MKRKAAASRRDQAEIGKRPTAADFTPAAVSRAVLAETIQHPATILALALGLVALGWSVFVDVTPPSVIAALACGFLGGATWIYNYFIRGEQFAEAHIKALRDRRLQHRIRDMQELVRACQESQFAEGAKEAGELTEAYGKLERFLSAQLSAPGSQRAVYFGVLAQDTYERGESILRQALNMFRALGDIDATALERECNAWRDERAGLSDVAVSGRREALTLQIDAHQKRLDHYRERERQLHLLLAEANKLEGELENAYLELTSIGTSDAGSILPDSGAATRLAIAVEAARRVEDRLSGVRPGNTPEDDAYYQAGREEKD